MSKQIAGMNQEIKAMADREGKYLTFILVDEEYGISIMKIQEIIGMMPHHLCPPNPGFCKGCDESSWKGDSGCGSEA